MRVEGNEVLGNKDVWAEYKLTPNPLLGDDGMLGDNGVERIVDVGHCSKSY
jgi:hypothetical protein